jgi:hypothetical protein
VYKLVLLSSCKELKQNSEPYYVTLVMMMMMMMKTITIITICAVYLGGRLCQMSVALGILNKNKRR